jgi:hypothetical protein
MPRRPRRRLMADHAELTVAVKYAFVCNICTNICKMQFQGNSRQFHDCLIPVTTYLAGAFKDFQSKGKLPARVRAMDMCHVFLILQFLAYSVCIFSMFCMFDILHILYVFAYFEHLIIFAYLIFFHTGIFCMFLRFVHI